MADDALNDIVSRPWFTRVWVYQELVLSNIVLVQLGRIDRGDWNHLPKDRMMLSTPKILDICEDKESETESRTSELSSMCEAMPDI
ncbi:hypothetical protein BOTCAL_0291g00040 [Botryotinia calthae]|uniref:Heterokaryon incompatibility domain-containing protein n=1 Tax=Botryotinia calthae TaxID=38488 RepID=A0A4Y8CX53_9HELO|nr:hypothetical protein BOTCAL_0291g00040 [Botryotinia calthae]